MNKHQGAAIQTTPVCKGLGKSSKKPAKPSARRLQVSDEEKEEEKIRLLRAAAFLFIFAPVWVPIMALRAGRKIGEAVGDEIWEHI
jgi:hypothetical protein